MTLKSPSAGRPRMFNEDDVLDKVMKLFWQKGYEGTALTDILEATGLAKGSIYKAFKSKHNLYLQSLNRYEAMHVDAAVRDLLCDELPLTRIDNFLSAPLKATLGEGTKRGCFLCNASADQAALDAETRSLVQRGFKKLSKAMEQTILEIKPDWTEKRITQTSESLLAVYSGLRIMSRSGIGSNRLEAAKAGALLSLS